MTSSPVFEQVVELTEDVLGPAARRFVTRQVSFHLAKQPEEVDVFDLPKLTEWMRVTLSMLTEDKRIVHQYEAKMQEIIKQAGNSH